MECDSQSLTLALVVILRLQQLCYTHQVICTPSLNQTVQGKVVSLQETVEAFFNRTFLY